MIVRNDGEHVRSLSYRHSLCLVAIFCSPLSFSTSSFHPPCTACSSSSSSSSSSSYDIPVRIPLLGSFSTVRATNFCSTRRTTADVGASQNKMGKTLFPFFPLFRLLLFVLCLSTSGCSLLISSYLEAPPECFPLDLQRCPGLPASMWTSWKGFSRHPSRALSSAPTMSGLQVG